MGNNATWIKTDRIVSLGLVEWRGSRDSHIRKVWLATWAPGTPLELSPATVASKQASRFRHSFIFLILSIFPTLGLLDKDQSEQDESLQV